MSDQAVTREQLKQFRHVLNIMNRAKETADGVMYIWETDVKIMQEVYDHLALHVDRATYEPERY